jgi:hypothetical protein
LVSFSTPNAQEPQIEEIGCGEGAWLENRTLDRQGQPLAYDQLQVADVRVNVQSGALTAGGPGWLRSVRRGSANPTSTAIPSPAQDQLNCLHVTFQKSIKGTLPLQKMASGNAPLLNVTFADHVRAAYAPVDRWDATIPVDDPDRLGPRGVTVRCDQLSVAEMPNPLGDGRSAELAASGNTVVEGTAFGPQGKFRALGNRVSYAALKDLVILEGDGRRDAELFLQRQPGADPDHTVAKRILYWRKTNRLEVNGARVLQVNQLPAQNQAPR